MDLLVNGSDWWLRECSVSEKFVTTVTEEVDETKICEAKLINFCCCICNSLWVSVEFLMVCFRKKCFNSLRRGMKKENVWSRADFLGWAWNLFLFWWIMKKMVYILDSLFCEDVVREKVLTFLFCEKRRYVWPLRKLIKNCLPFYFTSDKYRIQK